MGSQGGRRINGDGATQTHIQTQNSISNPLARQGSLYNLTLDEVQNQLGDLGKPLSSMNLDELLKTVWTAEGNDQTGESSTPVPRQGQLSSLDRQSSINLSQDLSKKTVDEVWQHIQQEQGRGNLDRKATLGEITLEDFLVKAGVVAETVPVAKSSGLVDPVAMTPQAQWMNYQMSPLFMPSHPVVQHPISLGGNSMMDGSYNDGQMNLSSSPQMGNLSDNQTPGRKRAPGEIAEKSVERRQKRMIKNRESAARSRARKQAYTHELENKVSRLEEENERLRRQKEWEMAALPATPPPPPKTLLRRTNSAPI